MQIWLATVLAAGVLTASAPVPAAGAEEVRGRQADFAAAAREYGVPVSVLLGVAYLESRWDANGGRPSTAGGYGPMHLVDSFPAGATGDGVTGGGVTGDGVTGDGVTGGGATVAKASVYGDAVADPRGDDARPMARAVVENLSRTALSAAPAPPRATLPEAGRLTGLASARLREDPAANIRAGAALLASYQERPSSDPADWHGAVARYAGTDDPAASRAFADEVFSVMREGAQRRTDDGHEVRLDPMPGLSVPGAAEDGTIGEIWPGEEAGPGEPIWDSWSAEETGSADETGSTEETGSAGPASRVGPKGQAGTGKAECPASLACEWMPAAYKRFGKKKNRDYGNHDRLARKRTVDYIVIHDTEGTYQGIPSLIRNPRYVSWHYTIRSRDGHVAQHVATNDIAWHAGNWDVNTRSIGIEHEGYLAKGGTWYTEAMYRSSAKLVKYLAGKYGIPLTRARILGHDNVPGTTPQTVAGMHEDPGPYWDWAHYFELMGKPFKAAKDGDSVIIRPSYATHRPRFTGCVTTKPAQACPPHGASTVWLHKSPSHTAPLVDDVGKHPGKPSTYSVYDHSARASTGQRYAVAARQGDWTAIWYLGQKAWFHNPAGKPTAIPAKGPMVTPLSDDVKVYGRAYPEKSAYKSAARQALVPLKYKIAPGQTYTVGGTVNGSYYAANAYSPSKHVTTTGKTRYHQIQLGHRVMFVKAEDVRLID
ncbi:N-acetylmuramoyl-L-alanine amidase [Nonomuraea candida]|uniref:N-acetylmuramoyl-L-alanine amidase n=1 Tax=Nonomuraea candida TaxID=359159 RepID=UPI0005BB9286|nr:N-acetylmuramoyl-L-alanine amidase [Nonomuraea candida]